MPHVTIEYSGNLDTEIEPMAIVRAVHAVVLSQAAFEAVGVRTRAVSREHFVVADGDPSHAFIAVTARIGQGRTLAQRQAASEAILGAVYEVVKPIYESRGLLLSVEVTELDSAAMTRRNSLRERANNRGA